ncbi:MAG: fibronectin type III domain-containing protein, partial [Nitrospirales bacterium]
MFRDPVCSTFRKILVASILGIGVLLIPAGAQSATNKSATLQWAPNQESDLAGYRVYYGKASGIYGSPLDVGKSTTYQFVDLESDATHYFAITAYNSNGIESSPSQEVSLRIPGPDSVLSVLISGGGKVTSQPASLSCTNVTCKGTFTQGSSVTLTAVPGAGNTFSGWAGACTGTASCVLTLSAPSASISANFVSTEAPKMVNPALGSTLTTSTATFQWNPGRGVEQYYLSVGTSQGAVDHAPYGDIISQLTGTNSSQAVSGIPLT